MLKRIFKLSPLRIAVLLTTGILFLYIFNVFDEGASERDTSFINLLDKKWIDFIQKNREPRPSSDKVVLAVVDAKSIDALGRWPWPRSLFAQLVAKLNETYQVRNIGFDIVFSEKDDNNALLQQIQREYSAKLSPEQRQDNEFLQFLESWEIENDGDLAFSQVMKQYDNVVLGYLFFDDPNIVKHLPPEEFAKAHSRLRPQAISIIKGKRYLDNSILRTGLYPEMTIEKISGEDSMMGFFSILQDVEDGVTRRVHAIFRYENEYYPALALKMLEHYYQSDTRLFADENGLTDIILGEHRLNPYPDSSFLINYKGPSETFPHYSIIDILEGKIPKEQLQDKMVLVGVTEAGLFDLRVTPVQENFPGLEVHANLLDNLLTDTYFRLSLGNRAVTMLLILGLGIALGLILPRIPITLGIVVVLCLSFGYTLLHRFLVNEFLSWPSYIYVMITMLLTSVSVWQYMYFVTDKDKRFIKEAFQQYLSPAVINQLMGDPGMLKLGGEEKELTCMFSDVAGFSTVSEQLSPSELVALLNDYLSEMSDIIMNFEGTVDKFEGDAIIAFFGAPVTYADHATRCALVALEMQNRLAELRSKWKHQGKYQLFQRIGINTGRMVVGNMGSRNRFDYTIMGNAVNLAARLEGANKVYRVETLISEHTYEQCQSAVECRELDTMQVVGIKEPLKVYEILARKGELDPHRKKAFDLYHQGLQAYREARFDEAINEFTQVLGFLPNDGPASVMLKRSETLKAQGPLENWNGVYVATSK